MAVAFRLRSRPAISFWTVDQVCDFLETAGLDSEVCARFRTESVTGRVLCQITDQDLSAPPFELPFGLRKSLLSEVEAQKKLARARERQEVAGTGPILAKGQVPEGHKISQDALERIRKWRLEPLSDEELECWEYQASWLVCPITGKAWARSDVVSTMGVALYHAPRYCSEREKQRLFLEEEQARRYDTQRKAAMDHSGTKFERDYEVYPIVEPPPLANLPFQAESSDASDEQLQRLRMEVSSLKGRSAAVQREMFEGLQGDAKPEDGESFLSGKDVGRALEQLKTEPKGDLELAQKFGVYESYFSGVVELRSDLFGLWERCEPVLARPDATTMRAAVNRVDSFENLSIPERSRHWFVYHMMSTASSNHGKMQKVLEDLEDLFETAQDRQAVDTEGHAEELSDDPQLGIMEVIIGPSFDMDAYNDGVRGNAARAVLPAADRGVLDMDRQYNAVNFQYFAQQADAGVTREGAEASFKRRLCTSRLSFYIEESHGSRIFPRNILSQLSLLFYRRNDALRLRDGQVNEARVAVCIRKAIPRILRAIVVDVFQGDRGFAPHMEKAVRVYLAVHQVAIKLLATFRKSYELLYQSVLEWIQQPFCPKSDSEWPDLEELLLGASLCAVPWSLLREAFVRRLFVHLLSITKMSAKAPIRQRAEHLFTQNRALLERLSYILAFFQAGPGKLSVQEMDKKYSRCAGSLPKAERAALVEAAREGGLGSLSDLWAALGMQRGAAGGDEEAALQQLEVFLEYVQSNLSSWKAAPAPPAASEGPALPPAALEQLALIGAQTAQPAAGPKSSSKREREMALARARAAEKAQHQGFPTLPPSRRLDGTLCYYCQRQFPSRMALFAHLRKMIDKDRFVEGHHEAHFQLSLPGGPDALPESGLHRCKAKTCGKSFTSKQELWRHYHTMGVPGFEEPAEAQAADEGTKHLQEDSGPATEPVQESVVVTTTDLSRCAVCLDKAANVVMVPCGHIFACQTCGQKLKECAVCRASVSQVLKVYYSADLC